MAEKGNIDKLEEYGKLICGEAKTNIKEGISKLTDSVFMIGDMQKIVNELAGIIHGQQHTIEMLNRDILSYQSKLEEKNEYIEKIRKKEETYAEMEADAVRIAVMLSEITEREKLLKKRESDFLSEKEAFDRERKKIIFEKDEALSKIQRAYEERDTACAARDGEIGKRKAIQEQCEGLKRENKELLDKVSTYEQEAAEYDDHAHALSDKIENFKKLARWYQEYAMAVDQKIIHFFDGDRAPLKTHYTNYLINPNKLDEIRKYFPEFVNRPAAIRDPQTEYTGKVEADHEIDGEKMQENSEMAADVAVAKVRTSV